MSQFDEHNHPKRRKEDQEGAHVYPGRRRDDVADRSAGPSRDTATRFETTIQSGASGITVQGPLIVCMAPDQGDQAGSISQLVRELADKAEQ